MTRKMTHKMTHHEMTKKEILADYALACESREMSLLGRKEVFMGKAKFGIFGDGKEVAQVAMAHAFAPGDFRAGYYRDQTLMMAIGALTAQQFFAQLYAHADLKADPASAGRMMNSHFATRLINAAGKWENLLERRHSSADISCTAGQMPRMLGLAYASKLYRTNPALRKYGTFSSKGREVVWGTIGNAGTSEGLFFETFNAAGVLQVPWVMSVWDDAYGISVPQRYHTVKEDISLALQGFARTDKAAGYEIFQVQGWDYEALRQTYAQAAILAREKHIPVLVHVVDLTQPQGHSTSGSHERYKSKERLAWEKDHDGLKKMKAWMQEKGIASADAVLQIEKDARQRAKTARDKAWAAFTEDIQADKTQALAGLTACAKASPQHAAIQTLTDSLSKITHPLKSDLLRTVRRALYTLRTEQGDAPQKLRAWLKEKQEVYSAQYHSHLYSESAEAAVHVQAEAPRYAQNSPEVDGREILQACFDAALARDPRLFAIGEDLGKIGDVNQGFAGLQEKYGEVRVSDTGIREASIVGQGIGAAMRGLRPLVEIQYLDYLLFALQTLSDDLATLRYRTKGGQKAPVIVRTRGHRLEGIWHSGSPMGMVLHSLRGMYVAVPRNMTQAAGLYNTLLAGDDPALVVECLNAYRLKERMPKNVGTMRVALGKPETLREGTDLSLVTYGALCRLAMEAAGLLEGYGIQVEVIDVQTLLPFDVAGSIAASLQKTNRLLIVDEDVPGGASAYILQQVLETQKGYGYLDSAPVTLSAKAHRPAYGTDGDYFSKPHVEDMVEAAYAIMHEAYPLRYPALYPS